ncbi:SsgA family sporulation/cell division regulator [Streptacidiphilus rugosus]|uniref:SsgA family sporulation/cell division regulator n=1 Tax=Streptacidiphilus rugosus TaxID=405783 RepID=UPI0007C671A2|nr:SsgA family sporulation/cell division regulator [Streptacidiphilus rugosus]
MPSAVHSHTVMHLVVHQEHVLPLLAHLDFDAGDPCAVRLSVHLVGEEPVQWVFARTLLTAGLTEAVGDGDVRIRPLCEDEVEISLGSVGACAELRAPADALALFVQGTEQLVPVGREEVDEDLDEQLASILGWQDLPGERRDGRRRK